MVSRDYIQKLNDADISEFLKFKVSDNGIYFSGKADIIYTFEVILFKMIEVFSRPNIVESNEDKFNEILIDAYKSDISIDLLEYINDNSLSSERIAFLMSLYMMDKLELHKQFKKGIASSVLYRLFMYYAKLLMGLIPLLFSKDEKLYQHGIDDIMEISKIMIEQTNLMESNNKTLKKRINNIFVDNEDSIKKYRETVLQRLTTLYEFNMLELYPSYVTIDKLCRLSRTIAITNYPSKPLNIPNRVLNTIIRKFKSDINNIFMKQGIEMAFDKYIYGIYAFKMSNRYMRSKFNTYFFNLVERIYIESISTNTSPHRILFEKPYILYQVRNTNMDNKSKSIMRFLSQRCSLMPIEYHYILNAVSDMTEMLPITQDINEISDYLTKLKNPDKSDILNKMNTVYLFLTNNYINTSNINEVTIDKLYRFIEGEMWYGLENPDLEELMQIMIK